MAWATILIWLGWHGINIFIAWQNKQVVQKRLNHHDVRQIEHALWFTGYCIICAPFYWIQDIWYAVSLVALHGSVFPYAYNKYRGLKGFNLSLTTNSSFDKLQVRMGLKSSALVNIGCELISIALLIISIFKK